MIKQQQRINTAKRKWYRSIKIIQNNQKSKSLLILKRFHFHVLSYIKKQFKKRKTEEPKVVGRVAM